MALAPAGIAVNSMHVTALERNYNGSMVLDDRLILEGIVSAILTVILIPMCALKHVIAI